MKYLIRAWKGLKEYIKNCKCLQGDSTVMNVTTYLLLSLILKQMDNRLGNNIKYLEKQVHKENLSYKLHIT
jgi:hypothetical protein